MRRRGGWWGSHGGQRAFRSALNLGDIANYRDYECPSEDVSVGSMNAIPDAKTGRLQLKVPRGQDHTAVAKTGATKTRKEGQLPIVPEGKVINMSIYKWTWCSHRLPGLITQ